MPSTSLPPTPFYFFTWNIFTIGLILATLCVTNGKYPPTTITPPLQINREGKRTNHRRSINGVSAHLSREIYLICN